MTQWTLVALVLLGACANVANLLLARGAARRREIATRLALGARRSRIVRQLLTESVMLACIGTIAGLGLAVWGRGLLLSSEDPLSLDWYVLGFSAIVALSTAVIFGLVPSLRATRLNLAAEFRSGARQLGRGAGLLLNRVLMALQIALSLVLLVGAGLFMRTLGNLHDVDAGFNRDRLLLFSIDAQQAGYVDDGYANLFGDIVSRIEALPGVRSATFSSAPLLSGNRLFAAGVAVPGNIPQSGEEEVVPFNHVAPGFFETMEMPILRGRSLTPADDAGAPRVVVISRGMAAKFFGGEDPVGRSIRIAGVEREVVGVVGDVRYTDLRQSTPVTFYLPIRQEIMGRAQFAVRTEMDPATVAASTRRAVAEIDRNLPIGTLRTQEEALEQLMAHERSLARLATFFGLLALGLTAVGLYGLMSYVTLRRTAEVGLRRALGASSTNLLRTFISESLALWAGGVVIGLAVTVMAARLIEGTLFGVPAIDATTYAGVILILLGVTIAAVWVPAWRAAKLDPMVALRQE
jgi:predicted permease